jgi:hypothetical protein
MEDGEEKERRKEMKKKEKKITVGNEGFSRAGTALLAVQWVAALRCN